MIKFKIGYVYDGYTCVERKGSKATFTASSGVKRTFIIKQLAWQIDGHDCEMVSSFGCVLQANWGVAA